jgi:hypothetical protein
MTPTMDFAFPFCDMSVENIDSTAEITQLSWVEPSQIDLVLE